MVVLSVGCANREAQEQARIRKELLEDRTVPVTLISPKLETLNSTLEISGPLKTLREVEVGAGVEGRLTAVTVEDGSRVRRGQLIAQVETADLLIQVAQAQAGVAAAESARAKAAIQSLMSPEQTKAAIKQAEAALSSAKARLELLRKGAREQEKRQAKEEVNAAKAQLDKAKADLDRMKELFRQDAVSRSDVDAAQLAYEVAFAGYRRAVEAYDLILEGARPEEVRQAEEAVRQAEEQLRSARANAAMDAVRKQELQGAEASLRQARAQLRLAQQEVADAAVRSPIDGYVSGKPAQVGQVVSPGTPVATVVSLGGVYFEGQIPETQIGLARVGQRVEVRVDALPGNVFTGIVVAISPSADLLGRLFSARVSLSGERVALRPGMFARGRIVTRTIRSALMVPKDALLSAGASNYLFVAENGKARRVSVTAGEEKGDWVQVRGLAADARVVVGGKENLAEGTPVREDKARGQGV